VQLDVGALTITDRLEVVERSGRQASAWVRTVHAQVIGMDHRNFHQRRFDA
jgi:hypothetical protein